MTPADKARWDASFAAITATVPHLGDAERQRVIHCAAAIICEVTYLTP